MPSTINVSRTGLVETMKANRDTHLKEYNEAKAIYLADYQKEMTEKCAKFLAQLAKDTEAGVINPNNRAVYSKLQAPESYVYEYDNKIAMFEMSVDKNIELTEQEFRQYVRDQWNWSPGFKATTANYLSKTGN